MGSYSSIYNRIQVRGPFDPGVPLKHSSDERIQSKAFSYWLGKIGDPQLGPLYLGWSGAASLAFGFIAIEIIGLNMWASVDWDPYAFVRNIASRPCSRSDDKRSDNT